MTSMVDDDTALMNSLVTTDHFPIAKGVDIWEERIGHEVTHRQSKRSQLRDIIYDLLDLGESRKFAKIRQHIHFRVSLNPVMRASGYVVLLLRFYVIASNGGDCSSCDFGCLVC